MKTVLSIAGSDSSGGAGIQADLKTMIMNGVYGMTAVTALTAQNTKGVTGILEVSPDFLEKQIDAVFQDIRPDAVKIGMVPSAPLMETIAYCLKKYQAENIVVDPVMVATSGSVLMETEAAAALKKSLLPVADLATPNIPEAEALSGRKIKTSEDMEQAAKKISEVFGCGVLCKGGHSLNDASDYLFYQGKAGGSGAGGSIIPTPTGPAVLFPVRSLPVWRRDIPWRRLYRGQKNIFQEPLRLCWIWAREAAPWIMDSF